MKNKIFYILSIVTIISTSCEKFVEIDSPKNLVDASTIFNSDETAIAATQNLYIVMNDSKALPFYLSATAGLYVDELEGFSTDDAFRLVYLNSLSATNNSFLNVWQKGYNIIYQANAIIEGCKKSNKLTEKVKIHLIAEAHFVRAYWHFYLNNFYGEIPIITSTDYTINAIAKKSPQKDIYQQIISDLVAAENNLPTEYVNGNTTTVTSERIRPNKYTADALLARVYLYMKDYSNAEQWSTKIINNSSLYSLGSLEGVFLKSSTEAIWEIKQPIPNTSTLNTYESLYFTLIARPSTQFANSTALSQNLLDAFENGDNRKSAWTGKYTDKSVTPNVDYYYSSKYKSKSTSNVEENTIIFRLAEQHLIRAEARLIQGNIQGARDDLNIIRHRAGLPESTADDQDLLNEIIKERRIELFTEWGHRLFDLKRTGKIDEVMNLYCPQKGTSWSSYKKNFPIPQREIDNNPNLKQNEGYN